MGSYSASVLLVVCGCVAVLAMQQLPPHARSGLAAKHPRFMQRPVLTQEKRTLDARLDHNDPNSPTFKLRYYVDKSKFKRGNPCFFSMGGEGPNNGIGSDYVTYLADIHKALVVSTEHRFYGESVPFNNFTVDNLKYLTSRQALADAAQLIETLNGTEFQCSKWIAFGGSYSGALSAWFRIKYDRIIDAALSSSGVVNAILNFTQFDVQVREAIGTDCATDLISIKTAFTNAVFQGGTASAAAKALFGISPDMADGDFAYMLADSAAMADQYGSKANLCNAIQGSANQPESIRMQTFANFTNTFWGQDFGPSCFYDSTCVKSDAKRWQPTARSWWWQKCYELAYWQVAPATQSLRMDLLTYEYHKQRCEFMFAPGIYPDTAATNNYYGGAQPNGSKIFFSDFSDDPWLQASVRKTLSPSMPYSLVQCDGCGHCMDLHYPSATDPSPLSASRKSFEQYLSQWLSE
eukprot:m.255697 g.255697  ORF g.255697 m.255697 type:complete len:464 (+) comp15505_c0_seq1:653-2044(+)